MFTTSGAITQPFIKSKLLKKKTRVLALILFYYTGEKNIAYKMLSCVICTIIKNSVCIDHLACQSKIISETPVGYGGGFRNGDKSFDIISGIGIKYLLMNLMSCH